ncbi:hypothetical protein CO046_00755 [Candidatus Peregrinibacteria bacterium CG_4_9_14_0_2_um_filter_53_11]|nr:MAG: hypothetical protein CO046_00755 [Candidatus Peregrinibacteria bacterium CG_4_9_14_0_2_um_filter_53_11]
MTRERLRDIVITPEEISAGFHESQQMLADYREVMGHVLHATDGSFGAFVSERGVSRSSDMSEYDRRSRQFDSWQRLGRVPFDVRAICELHGFGVFPSAQSAAGKTAIERLIDQGVEPYTFRAPAFSLVSMFNSLHYWRGHNQEQTTNTGHSHLIKQKYIDELTRRIMDGLRTTPVDPQSPSTSAVVAGSVSRLLRKVGGPVGHKGEALQPLTREVDLSLESVADKETPEDELTVARRTIRDFILALFHSGRCSEARSRGHYIILPYSYDEAVAQSRLENFLAALKAARMHLDTAIHPTGTRSGHAHGEILTHSHIIRLKDFDQFDHEVLQTEFHGRVEEILGGMSPHPPRRLERHTQN